MVISGSRFRDYNKLGHYHTGMVIFANILIYIAFQMFLELNYTRFNTFKIYKTISKRKQIHNETTNYTSAVDK